MVRNKKIKTPFSSPPLFFQGSTSFLLFRLLKASPAPKWHRGIGNVGLGSVHDGSSLPLPPPHTHSSVGPPWPRVPSGSTCSSVGCPRAAVPSGDIHLLQRGLLCGLERGNLLQRGLLPLEHLFPSSSSDLAVRGAASLTFSPHSSYACRAFCPFFNTFSQKHHRLLRWAWLCPVVGPFGNRLASAMSGNGAASTSPQRGGLGRDSPSSRPERRTRTERPNLFKKEGNKPWARLRLKWANLFL